MDKLSKLATEVPHCMSCMRPQDGTIAPAHSNQQAHGKGMGIKAGRERAPDGGAPIVDHMIAFMCHSCHHEIDNGGKLSREERINIWNAAFARSMHWLFMRRHVGVLK